MALPGAYLMQRIRIVYAKGRELMFTGNLDMQKVWERTFRRLGWNWRILRDSIRNRVSTRLAHCQWDLPVNLNC